MEVIRRIWEEIRRGENLDLYATVIVAFGLVILSLLGVNLQSFIAPLTLAMLGLFAISNLGNRYRLDQLLEKQSSETSFLEEFPESIKGDFAAGSEIWLFGVSLYSTVGQYYSEMERKLRKGDTFRVLLVNPEGAASEMAASRSYMRQDADRIRGRIRDSLQLFCDLRQIAPDKLEIRTIQNPLTLGAIAIDPGSAKGVLYLEHYPFRTVGGSLPKFMLRARHGRWYDFFRTELRALWDNAVQWEYDTKE